MTRPPPSSTLFPYTTLFRSCGGIRPRAAWELARCSDSADSRPGCRLAVVRRGLAPGAARLGQSSAGRSEEHTSELQSHVNLVCRLLLEKKKKTIYCII